MHSDQFPAVSFTHLFKDTSCGYPRITFAISSPPSYFYLDQTRKTVLLFHNPFLLVFFVCYARLCTLGNRLSVYSGSVFDGTRALANHLRPRSIVKDALFTGTTVALIPQTHIVEIKFSMLALRGSSQPSVSVSSDSSKNGLSSRRRSLTATWRTSMNTCAKS